MKNIVCAALVLALSLPAAAVLAASPTPAVSPAATASATPATRAKEWLHRLQTGSIDRAQLTDAMSALLTDATVASVAAQVGPLGDPLSMKLTESKTASGNTAYIYKVEFANDSTLYFVFVLDADGKISGLRFSHAE